MADENKNVSFWQKNWFAWLSFILFLPVGLFIMYTTREDNPTRWKIGAGLSLFAIVYWLATGEPVNNSIVVSLLTIVICAIIGILLDNIRRYWATNDADDEINIKKQIKSSFIALAVVFVIFGIANPSDEELKENERIAAMNANEKQIYEQKFTEYTKSMGEDDARTKAIADVDAYNTANEKITAMNDEEKMLYEQKFAEYAQTMNETSAREKAIADVEADTAAKNKALQEMYDKQKQYEEWLAQKEEQERKAQEKAAEEQHKAQEKVAAEQKRKEDSYWLVTRYSEKKHIEGEEYIGDWKDEHRDEIVAIYYIPSTKIRDDVDYILGKDPGYSVDVVEKIGGKPQKCITYHFKKSSNGWEWKIKRLLEIHDISQRNDLSEAEQKYKIPISEIPAGEKFYYYDKDPDASHNDHGDWYNIGGSNLATYVFNATYSTADDVKK